MTLEQIVESAKTKKYITYDELDALSDIDEAAGSNLYQNYRLDWESFWGLDLGDGEFIILNNLFQIEGPRPTTGLVGYHDNGNVDIDKTLALIGQAGEPAIKCYIDAYEAHLEEEAKAEEAKILAEKLNGANNG